MPSGTQQVATFAEVSWATIELELSHGGFREGIAKVYIKYAGTPLVDEAGRPIILGNGARATVTQQNFADQVGVLRRTLGNWVRLLEETSASSARVSGVRRSRLEKLVAAIQRVAELLAEPGDVLEDYDPELDLGETIDNAIARLTELKDELRRR